MSGLVKLKAFGGLVVAAIRNPVMTVRMLTLKKVAETFKILGKDPEILFEKSKQIKSGILMNCDYTRQLMDSSIEAAGWVLCESSIETLSLYLDDKFLTDIKCDLASPDLNVIYPEMKGSSNARFFICATPDFKPSPGVHRLTFKARATDGAEFLLKSSIEYVSLYANYNSIVKPGEVEIAWMRKRYESLAVRPIISVIITATADALEAVSDTVESLRNQAYGDFNITVFTKEAVENEESYGEEGDVRYCSSLKDIGTIVDGDFLLFMRAGDMISPSTLFEVALKIALDASLELIYTDEDRIEDGKLTEPFYKPGWSPDLLLSVNYIGRAFFISNSLYLRIGGFTNFPDETATYDLLLRAVEQCAGIGHIPKTLYSLSTSHDPEPVGHAAVLERALERRNIEGSVIPLKLPGHYRVKRDIADRSKVSIIILTAYTNPEKNIKICVRSIAEKSTYENYELVIVDNSRGRLPSDEVRALVPGVEIRIIKYDGKFNFSYMNNMGACDATGEYLIFLNDDTEVINPDWIESMMEHAARSGVGVVGSKMLYEDGTIQHGGVFLVDYGGYTRHAFRLSADNGYSYHNLLDLTRNCSAVTFANVMVAKETFFRLGGLEEELRVECNDIDFCLRALKEGLLVVWTPYSIIFHKESASRRSSREVNITDNSRFHYNRWRAVIESGDHYYNPNLTLDSDNFGINTRPVVVAYYEGGDAELERLGPVGRRYSIEEISEMGPDLHAQRVSGDGSLRIGISIEAADEIDKWPEEHFERLSKLFSSRYGAVVEWFDSGIEESEYIEAVARCDIFIGNNYWPAYVAALLSVPTLTVFSGRKSPSAASPNSENSLVVNMALQCAPCDKTKVSECDMDLKCLKMLWPEKVFGAAVRLLLFCGNDRTPSPYEFEAE